MTRIAILGGGSWGTALAIVLSRSARAHDISLWVHNANLAQEIQRCRENRIHLPGRRLPEQVVVTPAIGEAINGASIVIGAMPSAHARAVYAAAALGLSRPLVMVSATKGLEPQSHARIIEVISQTVPDQRISGVAVLSGPSFAIEAAAGSPTAVVLASQDPALASQLQEEFAAQNFRLYTNEDVLGVELAGAMKNVIAIAAGACQGLNLGSNALAALITRGLAEMSRLAVALGGRPETLNGLAGLGDLVLTCNGTLSRNRRVGIELAQGHSLPAILSGLHGIAEGVGTTPALLKLAAEHNVELPITAQVAAILYEGKSPQEAIRTIMERPQRSE